MTCGCPLLVDSTRTLRHLRSASPPVPFVYGLYSPALLDTTRTSVTLRWVDLRLRIVPGYIWLDVAGYIAGCCWLRVAVDSRLRFGYDTTGYTAVTGYPTTAFLVIIPFGWPQYA